MNMLAAQTPGVLSDTNLKSSKMAGCIEINKCNLPPGNQVSGSFYIADEGAIVSTSCLRR